MKKVFLVDDEMAIRDGIGRSINWEKEGYIFCGDASDGELALPLIEKHKPDIVITDIKMPFMDGLELSRILRNRLPSTKIIILSGHDEFDYAREAMRIQVTEYCLKPVSSQDLLNILKKVSLQIEQEQMALKRILDLKNQAMQSKTVSRDKFLYELCVGLYSFSEAINVATELNIQLISSYYYIIIVEYPNERENLDWIQIKYSCLRFQRKARESVFIMLGESKQELERESESIRKYLGKYTETQNHSLIFGIGRVASRIQGISLSFSEADEEKNYSKIIQKYSSKESEKDIESKIELQHFKRKDLIDFLKYGNRDDIKSFSLSYSSYLKSENVSSQFTIYYFLMDFTITISHFLKELEIDNIEILQEMSKLEKKASWIRYYPDVIIYMEKMLSLVLSSRNSLAPNYSHSVQLAIDYIHNHYSDSQLSLQAISEAVNVSASYLSHLFSQETGSTLIEYLTKTRIEQAKGLLEKTQYKTYEIANQVGYSDSHYFCRTFKKITGMTTKQYKNQKLGTRYH
ncbi:response regulator [Metabacillus malikii]|uniref:Two-component system response regulator YesN n=1 Tax=Metabacillus malikii TaxID=1504265 RepID=A0ABT9ZFW4_9BACI|nr:response regulator [Metabacillus malikii]MDQ0231175.1 two-component system response regulator YesN [Metabacillus malikii]